MGALSQILYRVFGIGRRGLVPAPTPDDAFSRHVLCADGTWRFQGLVYIGPRAGNAVPDVADNPGDFVYITSSGTSWGVAYQEGDWAIWSGTPEVWSRRPGNIGPSASTSVAGYSQLATEAEAINGTNATKALTPAAGNARVLYGDLTRREKDALFFGRGQAGSHVVWSNTEHGIIGTSDFTIALPVLDWWYATSGNVAGLMVLSDDATGGYAGTGNALTFEFSTGGLFYLRISDPSPDQLNSREYRIAKASLYDVAANKPGFLIIKRVAGVMSVRLNTQAIALPAETVNGSPVATWASSINSTLIRLGQVFTSGSYLGKLGVPLIYNFGLSDAECDILVTQGHRALPYRHGSFKNYAPTSGTSGWSAASGGTTGITITQYDLAADPDGIGLPAGGSTSDYCVKIVRSGGTTGATAWMNNIWRGGGPAWRHFANVKVTSLPVGTISYGLSSGVDGSPVETNGQINAASINIGVTVADNWKLCRPADTLISSSASSSGGPGITFNSTAVDAVLYVHAPRAYPLGMLFDGVVQPIPIVRDAGPNRMFGRLVNRVDPITDRNDGTFVAETDHASSANVQLCGGSCVPIGADISEVWARAVSGTPTISIGNVSAGAQVVSGAVLSTNWQKLSLVGGSHLTTTANLWVNSNGTGKVQVRPVIRLLS